VGGAETPRIIVRYPWGASLPMELVTTAPLVLGLVQVGQAQITNAVQDLELVHRINAALWQGIVAQLKVLPLPQNVL
jgi:hypothetical protein